MQESDILPIISDAMYLTQKKHDISISRDRNSFTISVSDSKGAKLFCEAMIKLTDIAYPINQPKGVGVPTRSVGGSE